MIVMSHHAAIIILRKCANIIFILNIFPRVRNLNIWINLLELRNYKPPIKVSELDLYTIYSHKLSIPLICNLANLLNKHQHIKSMPWAHQRRFFHNIT